MTHDELATLVYDMLVAKNLAKKSGCLVYSEQRKLWFEFKKLEDKVYHYVKVHRNINK